MIRDELPGDVAAVRSINTLAFGRPAEARLVDCLRTACPEAISLVAVEEGIVVGHILFTPATIDGAGLGGMGLAPMAVLPGKQRSGIGSALVKAGLARLREMNCPFVIVLGHPAYYPRFGFVPASRAGLCSQWPGVPDEAFMVLALDPGRLSGVHGTARYRPEFDEAL